MSTHWLYRSLLAVLAVELAAVSFVALKADDLGFGTDDEKAYGTEISTPLVGEYTSFAGMNPILIEGVGLVMNLHGTGGDPAPSMHRTLLMEDMKRRGIKNPNLTLQSPDTALVLLKAYLPPTMKTGDTLDVDVTIPDSAEATSLEGGWLLQAELKEHMFAYDGMHTGNVYARVQGPILIPGLTGNRPAAEQNMKLRRGRILGGAAVTKNRELSMYLKNDYRSFRNAQRIATSIGKRFHHFDQYGTKKPMAVAKTDQKLVLEIHPRYKDNYPRYLNVIRHIAFHETPLNQRLRMQRLADALLVPETAERASFELEAIGKDAVPVLKTGLKSSLLECRFYSAMALAYMEESEAIPVLADAARTERSFRVFALAGLSTLDDAQAHLALRSLMSEQSAETRYGAFRALWTLDRHDPFILGEEMAIDPPDPDEKSPLKSKRGLWNLHVLDAQGDPLVHCTMRTRPEIVMFGAEQKLVAPLALTVGRRIVITAQTGADTASVTRFTPNRPDERKQVPLNLDDIIHAVDELGATYPDVVQMLIQASDQHNLPGRLETDCLPESGRVYMRPSSESGARRKTTVGREHLAPNMFPRFDKDEMKTSSKPSTQARAETDKSRTDAMASVPNEKSSDPEEKRSFWNPFSFARKSADRK